MADSSGVHHDPDGPVVVMDDVPLAVVRGALGADRWLARPAGVPGWAAAVTRDADADHAAEAAGRGIPVIAATDDAALVTMLRSFDDGALITPPEAEALAWIEAVREEEVRNQRDARAHSDARAEELQARVDELEARATALNSHIAGIEASRAWRLSRRLIALKSKVTKVVTLGRKA